MAGETVEAFRKRAEAWLLANSAPREADSNDSASVADQKAFQAALYDAGFVGITCPKRYGGQGLSPAHQTAYLELSRRFRLPTQVFTIGVMYMVPTLLDYGSEDQKTRHIPRLLRGEEVWCMLFSEPGAGSDVASLQTRALKTAAGWEITGQKVWTSEAQHSDFGAIIARTDPTLPKHQGLSVFIVDMRQPGIEVRPLRVATGDAPFNEVFIDNAEAAEAGLIGKPNEGWAVGLAMLRYERAAIASLPRPTKTSALSFQALLSAATGGPARLTGHAATRLTELYVQEQSHRLLSELLREEAAAASAPSAHGSVGKLAGAELGSFAVEVALDVLGAGVAGHHPGDQPGALSAVLQVPSSAIAGGTNEIQRNIIAERILGLPKDPGVDRSTPFSELRVGTLGPS